MLPWIIQMSIISLVLIILVHYLFTFFKTNLTIPKVKDLVNKPQKQYEILFDTMKETNIQPKQSAVLPDDTSNMKNELKNYLKELSDSKKTATSTSIDGGNTLSTSGHSTANVNHNGGLLTNENLMGGSLNSSSYSSF
jgi:type II secretory pathway component PulC